MKLIQFIFGLIFIAFNEIIELCIKRPGISLLFIFGLWVNSLPLPDENIGTVRQDPLSQIERTLTNQKALGISGGGDGDGFINPAPSTQGTGAEGAHDRGADRLQDYDPFPKIPGGEGPRGNSGTFGALGKNKIPSEEDWNIDEWLEEGSDHCHDFEEPVESDPLPVPVSFEHVRDSNGNPTLLVPNIDPTRTMRGRTFNGIEYDQTASHLHHVPDFGIQLPPGFDMAKYNALPTKADKIQYAKQHVPPETIIAYQNAIGVSMTPVFGTGAKTYGIRGFAGKNRVNVSLVIQSIPNTNNHYLSIVNDKGTHISSYSINEKKLKKIIANDFWILPNKNFN